MHQLRPSAGPTALASARPLACMGLGAALLLTSAGDGTALARQLDRRQATVRGAPPLVLFHVILEDDPGSDAEGRPLSSPGAGALPGFRTPEEPGRRLGPDPAPTTLLAASRRYLLAPKQGPPVHPRGC